MKFEEVLPALREGKKVRRVAWDSAKWVSFVGGDAWLSTGRRVTFGGYLLITDDWEIVQEPKRVADYLVPDGTPEWAASIGWWVRPSSTNRYFKETHRVGSQPEGSVMVPGTEREEG
jgi:hypothetical protein